jgi:hypothetical protein
MIWIGVGVVLAAVVYVAYLVAAVEDSLRQLRAEMRVDYADAARDHHELRELLNAAIDAMQAPDLSALKTLTCAVESQSKLVDEALKRVPKGARLPEADLAVVQRMNVKRGRKLLRQRLAARAAQQEAARA